MRLDPRNSFLVVVDIQEKFMPAIPGAENLVRETAALARFARKLGVPVLATEQNPEKLGPTVEALRGELDPGKIWPKMTFSCCGIEPFQAEVKSLGRKEAVLCGIETQVCVLQTALDLAGQGIRVHLPLDALASRNSFEKDTALKRLEREGACLASVESVVFQWLERAGSPVFKEFQAHIKGRSHG